MDQILQEIIDLIMRMIATGETHQDYKRVCALAEEYRILTTGKDIEKLLRRFVRRESEEDYKLRTDITQAITPAVCASLKNPFYKVVRNDRSKVGIKLGTKANEKKVQKMIDNFFGSARSQNKGLPYWLKSRKFDLSFVDPNTWVVVEWKAVGPSEIPSPYPFEVPAVNALNFSVINDEVKWLFCYQDIKFPTSKDPSKPLKDGKKFTFYGDRYTVVFEQVDEKFVKDAGFAEVENRTWIQKIKGKGSIAYLVNVYEPKIGYPTAFRIGYKRDGETDGRTFVAPWHDAHCYFMKSLKAVSELDLTISSHVFPQKIQFAPQCPGESKQKVCNNGKIRGTEETCSVCKGLGYLTHSAANDVIYLPMPDVDQEHVLNLDNLIVYKTPPIDLVQFQKAYIDWLEGKAHNAVFNSQLFVKKENGGSGGIGTQTAFEIDANMQSIYDTLEAYTEKESELYREIVTVFALLCNEKPEKIDIFHQFPADFKLKTVEMLLSDLKAANESGAPSFLRDSINLDLAELVFVGDQIGLLQYRVKRKYFPFNGKSEDEIAILMSSEFVSKREKILYANFESIFLEIQTENPDFYVMNDPDKQFQIVEDKIKEWADAIAGEQGLTPSVDPLRIAAGGVEGGNQLKESVGGLTGMIEIAKAVASGLYDLDAAVALVSDRFGITEEEARKQLGTPQLSDDKAKIDKVATLT